MASTSLSRRELIKRPNVGAIQATTNNKRRIWAKIDVKEIFLVIIVGLFYVDINSKLKLE